VLDNCPLFGDGPVYPTSDTEKTFVALQFASPMTQKPLNLVKEQGKYEKMFSDRSVFGDEKL
jgi:hypothetical protein